MAEQYKVNNLNEAVNLARQFTASGQYNLFRGQSQNWKLKSTLARLNDIDYDKGLDQIKRLHYYFQTYKPLEKYTFDNHWFYAVAQHYGLPTNYIDFSTSEDIAAYFATNSKSNKIGQDCTIICLQENDFNEFIKVTKSIYEKDKVVAPYIVRPNVDNLWRLQAQKGCFLFTPYENFEAYYDFDRIIFPFNKSFNEIKTENVYPQKKSELEILLDQYFNTEKRREGQESFNKLITKTGSLHVELPPLNFTHLLKNNIIHNSWQTALFKKWMFKVDEEWSNPKNINNLIIHFNFKKPINEQIQEIIKELSVHFNNQEIKRGSTLKFEIIAKPKLSKKLSRIISNSCSRIWDGTRNLPFSDKEIQKILAKYICFEIYENKFDKTPSLTKENLISLELTNEYGSITRCYVSPSKIEFSFRDDLNEIICEKLMNNLSSEILLRINKPDLLFDFNKLLELFKDEIIPYQVLYNSEKEKPVIFYTPTQLTIMGYA